MNFLIYLFSMLIIGSLFFLYNKKKNVFLLIVVNIVMIILSSSSLIMLAKVNFNLVLFAFTLPYILGINMINYILNKNERIKNYLIYIFLFFISSSIWLFFFAFIVVMIGILFEVPGL